jgi:hypothetical protein
VAGGVCGGAREMLGGVGREGESSGQGYWEGGEGEGRGLRNVEMVDFMILMFMIRIGRGGRIFSHGSTGPN